jgi:hypothetical protein
MRIKRFDVPDWGVKSPLGIADVKIEAGPAPKRLIAGRLILMRKVFSEAS